MENKQIVSLLARNHPGVLLRIIGLFTRRGFNIDNITAGVTQDKRYSRVTIVVEGDSRVAPQVVHQVMKVDDVKQAVILPEKDPVCCEPVSYTHLDVYKRQAYHYSTCNQLDALAAQAGISKNYMCRIFKEHTGCTIIHYINQLRCYKAMSLIADGVSVTQAALQVGYSDYNYFSRVFKQIVGFSPSKTARKKKHT